jgi:hypothetical protein
MATGKKLGGGIATTIGYYREAKEAGTVNSILQPFNLAYLTDGSGHIVNILGGIYDSTHHGGVNVGQHGAATESGNYTDFINSPPFNYAKTVTLLQISAGVPLTTLASGPIAFATVQSKECPMTDADKGGTNQNSSCFTFSALSACTSAAPASNDGLPRTLGYYYSSGKARVVAWADEWLTYDSVWETQSQCGTVVYQPNLYWENVIRWLGGCNTTGNGP